MLDIRRIRANWHYAWIIVALTFTTLLASSAVRNAPGVIIKPLEAEFHWDRASISFAVAISLLAYGFGAPLGGSLVDLIGPRRVMLGGMCLIVLGLVPMLGMSELWQLHLLWGLTVGIGTGAVANVLGATIADRWFRTHRGIVIGMFGAAGAAGQLIFLPVMVAATASSGWRSAITLLAAVNAALLIPVVLLMRNHPQDVNRRPVGDTGDSHSRARLPSTPLSAAIRTRDFWLLAGSFFVCGYTTNGLIGTHLLPHTVEHGFSEVATAGALGLMGLMNVAGTLLSGWLSDRYDNRKLLATYYAFRGLSLVALPFIVEMRGLVLFAIVYGLDWIATVPPTVNLTATRFGRGSLGTLYGWIFCAHMIGASVAAYAGGLFREHLGDYHLIFLSAALMGIVAAGLSMSIGVRPQPAVAVEPAAAGD